MKIHIYILEFDDGHYVMMGGKLDWPEGKPMYKGTEANCKRYMEYLAKALTLIAINNYDLVQHPERQD